MLVIVINITIIILLLHLLWLDAKGRPLQAFLGVAFWLKCLASFMAYWVYWHYYASGDSLYYFEESQQLIYLARQDFSAYLGYLFTPIGYDEVANMITYGHEPRTILFVKLLSIFQFITAFHPLLITLHLGIISFIACWYLANTLSQIFPQTRMAAALAFLFFPSLLFWSGGLLKEPISIACLMFILHYFMGVLYLGKPITVVKTLIVLILAFLFYQLRYFFAIPVFALLVAWALAVWMQQRWKWPAINIIGLFLIAVIATFSLLASLHPLFQNGVFLDKLMISYYQTLLFSEEGQYVAFNGWIDTWADLGQNLHIALFSGLFGPVSLQIDHSLLMFVSFERLLLLSLSLTSLWYIRSVNLQYIFPLMVVCLFVVSMAIFIPFAAPNYGSLVRYQATYLPFFVYLVACLPLQKFFGSEEKLC
jgi:hypothetical protein